MRSLQLILLAALAVCGSANWLQNYILAPERLGIATGQPGVDVPFTFVAYTGDFSNTTSNITVQFGMNGYAYGAYVYYRYYGYPNSRYQYTSNIHFSEFQPTGTYCAMHVWFDSQYYPAWSNLYRESHFSNATIPCIFLIRNRQEDRNPPIMSRWHHFNASVPAGDVAIIQVTLADDISGLDLNAMKRYPVQFRSINDSMSVPFDTAVTEEVGAGQNSRARNINLLVHVPFTVSNGFYTLTSLVLVDQGGNVFSLGESTLSTMNNIISKHYPDFQPLANVINFTVS
jgi:hypothetical protein